MLNSKVGYSTKDDPYSAGKEAAANIAIDILNPKFAFMYSSCVYDQKEVIRGVKEMLPGISLVGCTSFTGVITPSGFITGKNGFLGMMAMSDDDMVVGVAGLPKGKSARMTGSEVAKKAMRNACKITSPAYFYMNACPGEEEAYLKGIEDVIGRVPFFGGSAADNSIAGEWKVFTDEGDFADGVAVAFFYTNKPFANKLTGSYKETDHVGIITKVDGSRRLVEIDGEPAIKVYAKWLNVDCDDLLGNNLLAATITNPLGVKESLCDLVTIRHPIVGNTDYSMTIGNNISKDSTVIMMEASVDELIDSTYSTLEETKSKLGVPPAAFHIVHCGGRRAGIDDRIDEVVENIKKAAGDVPFLGVFTFGEYGYEYLGINICGGLMLSFTGFASTTDR